MNFSYQAVAGDVDGDSSFLAAEEGVEEGLQPQVEADAWTNGLMACDDFARQHGGMSELCCFDMIACCAHEASSLENFVEPLVQEASLQAEVEEASLRTPFDFVTAPTIAAVVADYDIHPGMIDDDDLGYENTWLQI